MIVSGGGGNKKWQDHYHTEEYWRALKEAEDGIAFAIRLSFRTGKDHFLNSYVSKLRRDGWSTSKIYSMVGKATKQIKTKEMIMDFGILPSGTRLEVVEKHI